jgi:hypothetical protein
MLLTCNSGSLNKFVGFGLVEQSDHAKTRCLTQPENSGCESQFDQSFILDLVKNYYEIKLLV